MTRGRPPQKALDEALPIARARGDLLEFVEEPAFDCDFMFLAPDRFCIVRIKRTRHLWCTPEGLERQCAEAIAKFRHIHAPAFLSREIWFWSQYGVFRFFRIEDAGLVELDIDGNVLTAPRPERVPGKQPASAGSGLSSGIPGQGIPGQGIPGTPFRTPPGMSRPTRYILRRRP